MTNASMDPRRVAWLGGFGLFLMAVLAPFATFGVLHKLVVPADAAATASNLLASEGLFRAGIAAWLVVVVLDVVVAWALYVVLKPVHEALAVLVGWLRVVYAAALATAVAHLFDAVQIVKTAPPDHVLSAIASFENCWDLALAIFGFHLVGLGALLLRATFIPKWLALLVVLSGAGYLIDSFAAVLVSGSSVAVSQVTFVGEALLIFWFFWRAIKGFPAATESART